MEDLPMRAAANITASVTPEAATAHVRSVAESSSALSVVSGMGGTLRGDTARFRALPSVVSWALPMPRMDTRHQIPSLTQDTAAGREDEQSELSAGQDRQAVQHAVLPEEAAAELEERQLLRSRRKSSDPHHRPLSAASTASSVGAQLDDAHAMLTIVQEAEREAGPSAEVLVAHVLTHTPSEVVSKRGHAEEAPLRASQNVETDMSASEKNNLLQYLSGLQSTRYGASLVRVDGLRLQFGGQTAPYDGVNGDYQRSGEIANGRCVYVKIDQPSIRMWWANNDGNKCWCVGPKDQVGKMGMWAYVESMGFGPEEAGRRPWTVWSYNSQAWIVQADTAVEDLDPPASTLRAAMLQPVGAQTSPGTADDVKLFENFGADQPASSAEEPLLTQVPQALAAMATEKPQSAVELDADLQMHDLLHKGEQVPLAPSVPAQPTCAADRAFLQKLSPGCAHVEHVLRWLPWSTETRHALAVRSPVSSAATLVAGMSWLQVDSAVSVALAKLEQERSVSQIRAHGRGTEAAGKDVEDEENVLLSLAANASVMYGSSLVRVNGVVLHRNASSVPYKGVNGDYHRSQQTVNGRAVYLHSSMPTALWWANNDGVCSWCVGPRDAVGSDIMWAHVESMGFGPDEARRRPWWVYSYSSESWELQTEVEVVNIEPLNQQVPEWEQLWPLSPSPSSKPQTPRAPVQSAATLDLSGESTQRLFGVGIQVCSNRHGAYVVSALEPGGSAQQSGVIQVDVVLFMHVPACAGYLCSSKCDLTGDMQVGDVLHSIDGHIITKQGIEVVRDLIGGPQNTRVWLFFLTQMAKPDDLLLEVGAFHHWRTVELSRTIPFKATGDTLGDSDLQKEMVSSEWPNPNPSLSLALSGEPAPLEVEVVGYGAKLVRVTGVMLHIGGQAKPYNGVNGNFERSEEVANGRAVYIKVRTRSTAMWWTANDGRPSWCVGPKDQVGKMGMWAYVHSMGLGPEEAGTRPWWVYSYDSQLWQEQNDVSVTNLDPYAGTLLDGPRRILEEEDRIGPLVYEVVKLRSGSPKTQDQGSLGVDTIDTDGDGVVSDAEFSAYLAANRTVRYGARRVRLDGLKLHHEGTVQPYKGINGTYERSQEIVNGRALYVKVENPKIAMWWANNEGKLCWVVGPRNSVGKDVIWAYVVSMGFGPEEAGARPWVVYSYDSQAYLEQTGAQVENLDPPTTSISEHPLMPALSLPTPRSRMLTPRAPEVAAKSVVTDDDVCAYMDANRSIGSWAKLLRVSGFVLHHSGEVKPYSGLNGRYEQSSDDANGRPVYFSVENPILALWWGNTDGVFSWCIGPKEQLGTDMLWAYMESTDFGPPEYVGTRAWVVYSYNSQRWEEQANVRIVDLDANVVPRDAVNNPVSSAANMLSNNDHVQCNSTSSVSNKTVAMIDSQLSRSARELTPRLKVETPPVTPRAPSEPATLPPNASIEDGSATPLTPSTRKGLEELAGAGQELLLSLPESSRTELIYGIGKGRSLVSQVLLSQLCQDLSYLHHGRPLSAVEKKVERALLERMLARSCVPRAPPSPAAPAPLWPFGVGLKVTVDQAGVYSVAGLSALSPAEESGCIRKGEILHSIDGQHVIGEGIEEVRRLISGHQDSPVCLVFLNDNAQAGDLLLDVKTFDRWHAVHLKRSRPFTASSMLSAASRPEVAAISGTVEEIETAAAFSNHGEWPDRSASLSLALDGQTTELEVAHDLAPVGVDGIVSDAEFQAFLAANRTVRIGAEFVRISGVMLHSKGQVKVYKGINGDYQRSQEVANGRAVYLKVGKPTTAMWWANNVGRLCWVVGPREQVGETDMWAYVESTGFGPEEAGTRPWFVYSYISEAFEKQTGVEVVDLGHAREEPTKVEADKRSNPILVEFDLILDMNFSDIAGEKQAAFKDTILDDVAAAVGGDRAKMWVSGLEMGSVIVHVSFENDACGDFSSTLEAVRQLELQAAHPSSPLRQGYYTRYCKGLRLREMSVRMAVSPERSGGMPSTMADLNQDCAVDEEEFAEYLRGGDIMYGASMVRVDGAVLYAGGSAQPYKGINGEFRRSETVFNRRAVYTKVTNPSTAIWWANNNGALCWCVGPITELGKPGIWAFVESMGFGPEEAGNRAWCVFSYNEQTWEEQTSVSVIDLDPPDFQTVDEIIHEEGEEDDDDAQLGHITEVPESATHDEFDSAVAAAEARGNQRAMPLYQSVAYLSRPATGASRPNTGARRSSSRPTTGNLGRRTSAGLTRRPSTGGLRTRPRTGHPRLSGNMLSPLEVRVEEALVRQVLSRPQTPLAPVDPAEPDTKHKRERAGIPPTPGGGDRPSTAQRLAAKQKAAAAAVAAERARLSSSTSGAGPSSDIAAVLDTASVPTDDLSVPGSPSIEKSLQALELAGHSLLQSLPEDVAAGILRDVASCDSSLALALCDRVGKLALSANSPCDSAIVGESRHAAELEVTSPAFPEDPGEHSSVPQQAGEGACNELGPAANIEHAVVESAEQARERQRLEEERRMAAVSSERERSRMVRALLLEANAQFERRFPSAVAWKLPRKRGMAIDMEPWETPWRMLQGADWRSPTSESVDLTVFRHLTYGTVIELKHSAGSGKSFVFKASSTGSTPTNTPGNTPRHPDKVKICRGDGYVADWRFNANALVHRLEHGEGAKIPCGPISFGCWNFEQTDPAAVCEAVFRKLDADGSGAMEAPEVYEAAQIMGFTDMTEEGVKEWIEQHDEDGNGLIDAQEFKSLIGVDTSASNMKVTTAESSAELWLTAEGFVMLAHEGKNEAVVCVRGNYLPYTVPKNAGWVHLGRADEAFKRAEFAEKEAARKRKEEEQRRVAELAEQEEKGKKERERLAKIERRRQREAEANARALAPIAAN